MRVMFTDAFLEHTKNHHDNPDMRVMARELIDARTRLAEVRRRCVTANWRGTGEDGPNWWSCGICTYRWKDGEQETHEKGCPMEGTSESRDDAWERLGRVGRR